MAPISQALFKLEQLFVMPRGRQINIGFMVLFRRHITKRLMRIVRVVRLDPFV